MNEALILMTKEVMEKSASFAETFLNTDKMAVITNSSEKVKINVK